MKRSKQKQGGGKKEHKGDQLVEKMGSEMEIVHLNFDAGLMVA